MTDSIDWGLLSSAWQNVDVDTSACAEIIKSVRWRARLMMLGLVLECVLLIAVAGLVVFLLSFLPATNMLITWAVFGLLISAIAVVFRIRNSMGLWRSAAETTHDMLRLSHRRLSAIARTARFNRGITIIFSIALPIWTAALWWREPEVLLKSPAVSMGVFIFVILWTSGFWFVTSRTLRRSSIQLIAISELLKEFPEHE